jgi:hypothetical protein
MRDGIAILQGRFDGINATRGSSEQAEGRRRERIGIGACPHRT